MLDADYRRFARFIAPLLLLLPLKTAGRLVQNAVLLGMAAGVRELAAFAIAAALFQPFANSMGMAPQLTTVWAADRDAFRAVRRFVLRISVVAMTLLLLLSATPLAPIAIGGLYDLDADLLQVVATYLTCFAAILPLHALMRTCQGLLVRDHRSATVSALQLGEVFLIAAVLAGGSALGWPTRITIIASWLLPEALLLPIAWWCSRRVLDRVPAAAAPAPRGRELLAMFAPMAGTTMLFTISRPIIFAVITATYGSGARSEALIAALTLAFTTGFLFQGMINSMRHLMVAFADADRLHLRRFVCVLASVITLAMLAFVLSPAIEWFLRVLLGAQGEVLHMAAQAALPLIAAVPLIAWRNWHHGLGMVRKRTGPMFIGGLARNAGAASVVLTAAVLGILDHVIAASAMVVAFGAEAVGTILAARWQARRVPPPQADWRSAPA